MINSTVKIDLTGAENIKKSLVSKIIRKAVRNNSSPILKAAKANVANNKRTGAMFKSLTKKIKTYKQVVVAVIGPKTDYQTTLGTVSRGKNKGAAKLYKPSKVFHLIESGKKSFPGRHPLQQALDNTASSFTQNVLSDIKDGINEVAP